MRDAARELFVSQGYADTTMKQIAADAGVAVQTVYYTFKTKGALLCEVAEVTAAGEDDPVPVSRRAWMREAMAVPSTQRTIALVVEHGSGIYERVAVLWPAVNAAAAADPEVDEYWRGVAANRRSGQHAFVARIAELGGLRSELDVGRATDIVVVLCGHDVYRGLVLDAGWTVPDYKAWLFTTLIQQLLGHRQPDPEALRGLSYAPLVDAS
ncbi:TetR family transcriptional regulator [Haloactinopolyspora alba]|uniref:TetR family transcriptional regulator n=2 Tax=Haloactinopolyspora alba TaxID=648780 RepID=A0A2P8E576_9ACTN|nr:TetR family transcriptional regulator [Haloactinopolyspora alba]